MYETKYLGDKKLQDHPTLSTIICTYVFRYRIGPHEVESALVSHPAVLDAAVVGSPDPMRGEVSDS